MNTIRNFTVDFTGCKNAQAMHEIIKESLGLPDFYGRNLDALWDSLTGIMYTPAFVIIKGILTLPNELQVYADKVVSTFIEAQEEYGQIKVNVAE